MDTTLYNHVAIGTQGKPLIPNIIFKECIECLNNGDDDYYLEVLENYSLEAFQKQFLQSKYFDLCTTKHKN